MLLLNPNVSITILPVPAARNSKSLFEFVVVIKLSSTSMSPVWKVLAAIVPILSISITVNVPLTVKSPVISTLLFGITILPVPLARNSKSELESVVVNTFPTSCMFSSCTPLLVTSPDTVKFPVNPKSPV